MGSRSPELGSSENPLGLWVLACCWTYSGRRVSEVDN